MEHLLNLIRLEQSNLLKMLLLIVLRVLILSCYVVSLWKSLAWARNRGARPVQSLQLKQTLLRDAHEREKLMSTRRQWILLAMSMKSFILSLKQT